MVKFNGKITEKEYTNYLKTHFMYSTSIPKMMLVTILFWPIMEIINLISSGKTHFLALAITFIIILFASGCILGLVFFLLFRFTTLKAIKGLKEGDYFEEKEYIFSTESISITSKLNNTTLSWESIKRIRENSDLYYLYLNASDAVIVPKRYFVVGDLERFKSFVKDIEVVK